MKLLKASLLAATLNAFTLQAYIRPCPGDWNIRGEYLYLLPSIDDTNFVLVSPSDTSFNGTRENNDFDFHSGFRVGGAYSFCDCEQTVRAYYTRLNTKKNKTISDEFLSAIMGPPDILDDFQLYSGTASSELNLLYQRFDAFLDQQLWYSCSTSISLLAGLEYDYVRLREQYNYVEPSDDAFFNVNLKTKTWGIGPQLGLALDYNIFDTSCFCPGSLTLTSFGSASLLASKTNESYLFNSSLFFNPSGNFTGQHTWRIVPAFHARIGLNYSANFSCFGAALEVGYELNSYLRSITRILATDDVAENMSFINYYNFDVQGLYVALDLNF